jgi:hypothetical protein
MTRKIVWDVEWEEELLMRRHSDLLFPIAYAIEAAIKNFNTSEAEQGFGEMTPIEISTVMAAAVVCILRYRGVTLDQFLDDLYDLAPYQAWT